MALIVHGLTFLPLNVAIEEFPVIWLLHLGLFVVCIPFLFSVMKTARAGLIRSWWSVFPWWAIGVIMAAMIYTGANATFSLVEPYKQGKPEIQNGEFVLVSRDKTIHAISEQEYYLRKNYNIRGFSGHWILFYLIATLYFWFGVRSRASNKTSPVPLIKQK